MWQGLFLCTKSFPQDCHCHPLKVQILEFWSSKMKRPRKLVGSDCLRPIKSRTCLSLRTRTMCFSIHTTSLMLTSSQFLISHCLPIGTMLYNKMDAVKGMHILSNWIQFLVLIFSYNIVDWMLIIYFVIRNLGSFFFFFFFSN